MKNFYFTFGQSHYTKKRVPMKDYWVRVVANNWDEARIKFIENFSSVYMDTPDKWAFQYDEDDFDNQFFPNGEYKVIK